MAALPERDGEMPFASAIRSALAAGTGKIFWDLSSRSLSFVLSVLVARKLGAAGFGVFAVYWYSAWMLSQATDLGLHLASLRGMSRECRTPVFWSAVVLKGALTALVALGSLAAVLSGALSGVAAVAAPLLAAHLAGSWVELFGVALRSGGFIAREGFLLATLRAGWLAAAVASLSRSPEIGPLAAFLALSSVPAVALAVALLARIIGFPEAARPEMERLFREALPLGLGSAITLIYLRADLLVLALLRDSAEAGVFQSAFRVFEASFVLSGGIAGGTFPLLVSRLGKPGFEGLSRFLLGLLLVVAAPLACLFAFGGETLLVLLYGSEFRDGAAPLAFLGLALLAVFANALTTHLLVAAGRTRAFISSLLVRLAVGLGLDFLLIGSLGATGAAVAVAAAEWSLLVVSLFCARDLLGLVPRGSGERSPEEMSSCS
jgi:O-antigen/teichoic acid export membrane protein